MRGTYASAKNTCMKLEAQNQQICIGPGISPCPPPPLPSLSPAQKGPPKQQRP